MAKTDNPLLKGIRGKVGTLVFKQTHSGTVVTSVPDMDHVKPSIQQQARREVFAEAVAYARSINTSPAKKKAYAKKHKLKKGQTVFNAALQEYLRKNKDRHKEIFVGLYEKTYNPWKNERRKMK
jgi:hypothetical protein